MTTTLTRRHETAEPVLVRPAEVAPVGARLVALAVDQLLVVVCCLVTTAVWLAVGGTGRGLIVAWLVTGLLVETGQAFVEAVSGATLGGAVAHVRTVSARTGWPAGLIAVVVRRLVLTAGGVLLPVLGAYVVAGSGEWNRHPTRRGWHDWAADTLVLRDWAVPDLDARAAERARRQAARLDADVTADRSADTEVLAPEAGPVEPSSDDDLLRDGPGAQGGRRPAAQGHRRKAGTVADRLRLSAGRAPEPDVAPDLAMEPAPEPDVAPDLTAELVPEGDARPESAAEPAPDLTRVVPIIVPDLVPEPAPEFPRARHRATTLGLGRPRPQTPSGRHRVPEIPTQRKAPRVTTWPQLADDVELTRMSVGDVPRAGLRLVFDSGVRVEVVGNGVVGRDLTGVLPPPVHPVVVDDPTRTVSRVHLRFGPGAGRDSLWVMDENSTNGTILIRPDGAARVLPAGVQAVVGAGWQIRFGERAAVVESVAARPYRPAVRLSEAVDVATVRSVPLVRLCQTSPSAAGSNRA